MFFGSCKWWCYGYWLAWFQLKTGVSLSTWFGRLVCSVSSVASLLFFLGPFIVVFGNICQVGRYCSLPLVRVTSGLLWLILWRMIYYFFNSFKARSYISLRLDTFVWYPMCMYFQREKLLQCALCIFYGLSKQFSVSGYSRGWASISLWCISTSDFVG